MADASDTRSAPTAQQQPEARHPAKRTRRTRQPTLDQGRAFIDACLAPLPTSVTPAASVRFLKRAMADAAKWWVAALDEARALERALISLRGEIALIRQEGGAVPRDASRALEVAQGKFDAALEKLMRIPPPTKKCLRWKQDRIEGLRDDHPLRLLVARDVTWLGVKLER